LFGYEDSDCYAILEVDTGRSILFTPFYAESYKMWMRVYTLDEIKNSCGVD
jgi:Xaa-Pro dipeptidase